jgi:uncharacterized protein (DUF1501 family)
MVSTECQPHHFTRRGLLQLGVVSALGLSTGHIQATTATAKRCIFINLVGGPSQLDTWDPKPQAPSDYRGPFGSMRTTVPGISISELFPKMASMARHFALVRSVFHDAAPIHETGLQYIQRGNVSSEVASTTTGMLIPGPITNTGVQLSHGQEGLQPLAASPSLESCKIMDRYGDHAFGRACLKARQAVEAGHSMITVNMFQTVYNSLSWDCHADGSELNVKLADYRDSLAPMFDQTYTALLTDLAERGLLNSTLVVAAGEFGRSPKINIRGGRDHWTGAWTVLFAGGGVQGGQVIGSTDRLGMEPSSRPVHASAIANTVKTALGFRPQLIHQHGGPIQELFGGRVMS